MSTPLRLQAGDGEAISVASYGQFLHFFTATPSGGVGYAPNSIGVVLGAAAGDTGVYINTGTALAATWTALSLTEMTALTGLLATVAELNANNHAATRLVDATATLTVTQALHDGKTILLDASGGFTSTLPAATGSGSRFKFVVKTVSTTGYVFNTADQGGADTDIFQGNITTLITTSATGKAWAAASNSNRITLNGTTSGGVDVGDTLFIEDIAAGVYSVNGSIMSSGVMITPFSHV